MQVREARLEDIPQLTVVRNSVHENALADPTRITAEDYREYLLDRGKGWVYETQNQIAGFAIIDEKGHHVWALFVLPEYEKQGIGRQLHDRMLNDYFSRITETVWLSTDPRTRAAQFYRAAGWAETGPYGRGEIRFEMSHEAWEQKRKQ